MYDKDTDAGKKMSSSYILSMTIILIFIVLVAGIVGAYLKYSNKRKENAAIQKGKGSSVLVVQYKTSLQFQRGANCLAGRGYQVQTTSGRDPISVTYVKRTIKPSGEGPSPTPLLADELTKLSALKGLNILTEEEFQKAKALFLGKPSDKREEALMILKNLHGLYKAGVLSESEFNLKKWDILSRKV
ncbi:MAG: hypothetical protein NTV14_10145 [Coprothermobacterota bacterium]|nr:hypothetical protein [Coprothermobacterota bacterium]